MADTSTATQLRFVKAKTPEALALAISTLPFRVEIKGGPVKDGANWIIFFVPPDMITTKVGVQPLDNVDLSDI